MQQYRDWHIRDFTGGINNFYDSHLIEDNAAILSENFISLQIGRLKKRRGQARLNASSLGASPILGLHGYYKESGSRYLLCAHNGSIYRWDTGTSAWVSIQGSLNATAPYNFETCVNYCVGFNGINTPFKWDGTTYSALANAPTDGMYPLLYKEKLFVRPKSKPSQLWWSNSFYPEQWPAINYWAFGEGDGDEITCFKPLLGELVVFKKRSIHTLRGTSLDDFRSECLEYEHGCVGPRACALVEQYLYYVNESGIYRFNGINAKCLTDDKIPQLFESGLNKSLLSGAVVTEWHGLVLIALPSSGATYNDILLVYVPDLKAFWVWKGINPSCFLKYDSGSSITLYAGDAAAGYVNQQDTGTDDFGSAISAVWRSKHFDKGSDERLARAKRVYISDSPDSVGDVTPKISLDMGAYTAITAKKNDNLVRYYKIPVTSGEPAVKFNKKWRFISAELSHNALGACEVRGILIPFKAKAKPKGRNA